MVTPHFFKKHAQSMLVLWMIVIFGFSSIPGTASPYPSPLWYVFERKGAHVMEFFILAVLVGIFLSIRFRTRIKGAAFYWLIFLSCTAYALSDEIHQFFVFGRQSRFTDVLIDDIGIIIGMLTFSLWTQRRIWSRFFRRNIRSKKASPRRKA